MGAGATRLAWRGDRRARAMAAVGIGLILCGFAQFLPAGAAIPAPTLPANSQSKDINSYFLFALNSIDIKGGSASGPALITGNVGVNNPDPTPGNGSAVLEICTNRPTFFVDGTELVADTAVLNECDLDKLFVNTQVGSGTPVVRGGRGTFAAPWLVPDDGDGMLEIGELPTFPDFSCTVPGGVVTLNDANRPPGNPAPAPLAPGAYGNIKLDGGTLTLGPGVYTFCRINFSNDTGALITHPDTEVRIVEKLIVDGGTIGPALGAKFFIKNDGSGNDESNFGNGANVKGRFWAPFGLINLGRQTQVQGNFWAAALESDQLFNQGTTTTTVGGSTVPSTSTSTTSTSTSTSSTSTTSTTVPTTTSSTSTTSTSTSTTSTSTSTSTTSTSTTSTTSTTVPSTTSTSVGGTTSSLATTTTLAGSTTTVTFTGSTVQTVTTLGQTVPTTSTTTAQLPRTGGDGSGAVAGFSFILAGAFLLGLARRRPASA